MEATLQALDAINADGLAGALRLGAELRDSCWAPPTALRQTIDLVRDAIAPPLPPATSDAPRPACTVSTVPTWELGVTVTHIYLDAGSARAGKRVLLSLRHMSATTLNIFFY